MQGYDNRQPPPALGHGSERSADEQDDRDAWGEYPGQFGGGYDDAERRFGSRSSYPPGQSPGASTPEEGGGEAAQHTGAMGIGTPRREERARERGFRGQPPRGYTRSDERIREDVCECLTDADVDVSDVEVRVTKGVVTLSGSVPDRATKRDVESVAECVSGVTDIANQLRIRPSEHPKAEPASETEPREPSERPKVESDPEHRVER